MPSSTPRPPSLRSTSLHPHLSSLLPLPPNAQQRTRRTRQPDNTIIQINPTERRTGNGDVANVANQLDLDGIKLLLQLLRLNHLLRVGGGSNRLGVLEQVVVRVQARGDGEGDTRKPSAVALAQETGGEGGFADRCCVELAGLLVSYLLEYGVSSGCFGTYHTSIIAQHVECISQLPSHSGKSQHGIHRLRIAGDGRSAEVLDKLAHAHQLARRAERLLGCFIRGDGRGGAVRAVQVPGEEAGEVLERAEDFVASDWRGVSDM
jgi:hypothetical protein